MEEIDVDVIAVVEDEEDRERLENIAFDVSVENSVSIVPIIKAAEEFEGKKDTRFVGK